MPLAVFGGSFDPVHCGHVEMVRHVLDKGLAGNVLVIPAGRSPFKSGSEASSETRLDMARLAFAEVDAADVDDREVRRDGPSFMVDTLEDIHQQYPDRRIRLLIGADNVSDFPRWHRFEDILALVDVLVLGRAGHHRILPEQYASSFIFVPGFDQRVSSTEIRAILVSGRSVKTLLPASVARYIRDHNLYR